LLLFFVTHNVRILLLAGGELRFCMKGTRVKKTLREKEDLDFSASKMV
jgi:hypothetical protein